ncbi:MAG: hypothetical protein JWM04_618, partial [Verrucomicrobiales bacterium]|nr:hypothetical protein [Verrucomicrobiales bacterium]
GISEREAFKMAIHRIGSHKGLAAEFAIDEPAAVWKRRAVWLGMGWLSTGMLPIMSMALEKVFYTVFDGALSMWDYFTHNYLPGIFGSSQALHAWWQKSGNSMQFYFYFLVTALFLVGTVLGRFDRFIDWISRHMRVFAFLAMTYFFVEFAITWRMILVNPQYTPSFSSWQKNAYYLQLGVVSLWRLGMVFLLGLYEIRKSSKRQHQLI